MNPLHVCIVPSAFFLYLQELQPISCPENGCTDLVRSFFCKICYDGIKVTKRFVMGMNVRGITYGSEEARIMDGSEEARIIVRY